MFFLVNKIKERENFIDKNASSPKEHKELLEELHSLASLMNSVGVENEQDYKDFFYINSLTPEIIKNVLHSSISEEQLAKISSLVYKNRINYPINTIINFHKAVEKAIDMSEIPITKKAYPQGYDAINSEKPHNLNKWVQSMRKIYALHSQGYGLGQSFDIITEKWDKMEKSDFRHWLNFYQSGQQLAYKVAQHNTIPFEIGEAIIPLPRATIKGMPAIIINKNTDDDNEADMSPEQIERNSLRDRVKQLIGRLNAAERLFTTNDEFRKMLGNQFGPWLQKLHELKRWIQATPIDSGRMSYATIEDIIIKNANQLEAEGLDKSAKLMRKLAQAPPPPPVGESGGEPGGEMGAPDMLSPGGPEGLSEPEQKNDPDGAMEEFLANLGAEESEDTKDKYKEADINDGAIIVVSENDDGSLISEAQFASPEPTEMPEEEKPREGNAKGVDSAIEGVLKNVTMSDLIVKLEDLATLYKQRPLARELTLADLYMQALGISSYFPSMAEATKSALDSNQYVLTRIEEILAKLRGANETASLDEIKSRLGRSEENEQKKQEGREAVKMNQGPEAQPLPAPANAPEMATPAAVERPPEGVRVR